MKQITKIRQSVAIMANRLHKLGYSLSMAWKVAWKRAKEGMKVRVSGVTFSNRQELLRFISNRKQEDLTVYLRRDKANEFDRYAVAVVVGIKNIGYCHIGYLPRGLSESLSDVIDNGISLTANMQIIGGYATRETFGALLSIAI